MQLGCRRLPPRRRLDRAGVPRRFAISLQRQPARLGSCRAHAAARARRNGPDYLRQPERPRPIRSEAPTKHPQDRTGGDPACTSTRSGSIRARNSALTCCHSCNSTLNGRRDSSNASTRFACSTPDKAGGPTTRSRSEYCFKRRPVARDPYAQTDLPGAHLLRVSRTIHHSCGSMRTGGAAAIA